MLNYSINQVSLYILYKSIRIIKLVRTERYYMTESFYKPVEVVEFSPNPSPNKPDIDLKKERRRKNNAFKTFLNKIEPSQDEDLVQKRKISGETIAEFKLTVSPMCKICKNDLSEKSKECEFCNDLVCMNHIRKKRRGIKTNKYCRICDYCEDKYIYEKHLKNQRKTEEALVSQELIVYNKYAEMKELVDSKRIKLIALKNQRKQLQEIGKKEIPRLQSLEAQLDEKLKKIVHKHQYNDKVQKQLEKIENSLPPSLEVDYNILTLQNAKVTKDLVKYENQCNDAIKARSQKQKDMYEEYYEWEENQDIQELEQKKDECLIY